MWALASARTALAMCGADSLRQGAKLGQSLKSMMRMVPSVFDNPYITVSEVMDRAGLTRPGALKLIASMEEKDIIKEISGRMRGRVYLSESIRSAAY